jgi:predicted O-methyltransferase YrrM
MSELETSDFMRHICSCLREIQKVGGAMSIEKGLILYVLSRALCPQIVLETGVANGISSSFILKALDKNSEGTLTSIDLHYRDGVSTPPGKQLGWVIPNELKQRWNLVLGESIKVLPMLLSKLGRVDIFLHDSRHTYKTMISEYTIVWPFLMEGGLLISDDVRSNDAFLDFADSVRQTPVVIDEIGAIRKTCTLISSRESD